MEAINLEEKFSRFNEYWTPKIIGELNGQYVKLAKAQGEMPWHAHNDEDEFFLVVKGKLVIRLRDGEVTLGPGECYVVPRGVEHAPKATEETHVLLFEPKSTAHTGETVSDLTVSIADQEWI